MGTPLPFLGKAIVGCSFTSKEKAGKERHDSKLHLNAVYLWKLSGSKESFGVQTVMITVTSEIRMINEMKNASVCFKGGELPPCMGRLLLVKEK